MRDDGCISRDVVVRTDLKWHAEVEGKTHHPATNAAFSSVPICIESEEGPTSVLQRVGECSGCSGNNDPKYISKVKGGQRLKYLSV